MNEYEEVPLKNDESVLPVYGVSGAQFAFSGMSAGRSFEEVRLEDNSRYQIVRMRWRDEKSTTPFLPED